MTRTMSMTAQVPARLLSGAQALGSRWTAAASTLAAGLVALATATAVAPSTTQAMPLAPLPPTGSSAIVQVQGCGPPIRGVYIDAISGIQSEYWRPRPCPPGYRGGYERPRPQYYEERPRPRYYEERPAYRPAPRYYEDDERAYRPRRPPPPGWERDPYTGRDTRILR